MDDLATYPEDAFGHDGSAAHWDVMKGQWNAARNNVFDATKLHVSIADIRESNHNTTGYLKKSCAKAMQTNPV
jgi:hypothetical protein